MTNNKSGRYSQEELSGIDKYADMLGIEVIFIQKFSLHIFHNPQHPTDVSLYTNPRTSGTGPSMALLF